MDVSLIWNLVFWIGSILSLVGAFFNARHKRWSFLIWMMANVILMYQVSLTFSWNLFVQYLIFLIAAIYGWFYWGKIGISENKCNGNPKHVLRVPNSK
jgi:nicotinamide riboside transporter PnuC